MNTFMVEDMVVAIAEVVKEEVKIVGKAKDTFHHSGSLISIFFRFY